MKSASAAQVIRDRPLTLRINQFEPTETIEVVELSATGVGAVVCEAGLPCSDGGDARAMLRYAVCHAPPMMIFEVDEELGRLSNCHVNSNVRRAQGGCSPSSVDR